MLIETSRLIGAYKCFMDPQTFLSDQIPPMYRASTVQTHAASTSLTLQVANMYLLLAEIAIVICFCSSASAVQGYLFVVAIADLGQ